MKKFSFCPCCGGRLVSKLLGKKRRLVCKDCKFIFYQNSKPCVGGIVIQDGKILLTKRGISPYEGYWDIPGGFLEEGEDPEVGLKRELLEELGLHSKIKKLFGIFMDRYGKSGEFTLSMFYFVEPQSKVKHVADDVCDFAFFPLHKLPSKIAFRCLRVALKKLSQA